MSIHIDADAHNSEHLPGVVAAGFDQNAGHFPFRDQHIIGPFNASTDITDLVNCIDHGESREHYKQVRSKARSQDQRSDGIAPRNVYPLASLPPSTRVLVVGNDNHALVCSIERKLHCPRIGRVYCREIHQAFLSPEHTGLKSALEFSNVKPVYKICLVHTLLYSSTYLYRLNLTQSTSQQHVGMGQQQKALEDDTLNEKSLPAT